MQHDRLRTIRRPCSIDKPLFSNISDILIAGPPASARSESTSDGVRGNSSHRPAETENPKKHDNEGVRRDPLRDLPEWLV